MMADCLQYAVHETVKKVGVAIITCEKEKSYYWQAVLHLCIK